MSSPAAGAASPAVEAASPGTGSGLGCSAKMESEDIPPVTDDITDDADTPLLIAYNAAGFEIPNPGSIDTPPLLIADNAAGSEILNPVSHHISPALPGEHGGGAARFAGAGYSALFASPRDQGNSRAPLSWVREGGDLNVALAVVSGIMTIYSGFLGTIGTRITQGVEIALTGFPMSLCLIYLVLMIAFMRWIWIHNLGNGRILALFVFRFTAFVLTAGILVHQAEVLYNGSTLEIGWKIVQMIVTMILVACDVCQAASPAPQNQ